MNKFCENCGNPLYEGTRFCDKCGKPVEMPAPGPAVPVPPPMPVQHAYTPPPPQYAPAQPRVKKSGNALCIALAVLLVLQTAAVALFGWPGFLIDKAARPVLEETENGAVVTFPERTSGEAVLDQMSGLAIRQYTLARLKLDALLELDMSQMDKDTLEAQMDDAAEAWRLADELSTAMSAVSTLNLHKAEVQTAPFVMPAINIGSIFMSVAYAADEENAGLKWAKSIQRQFDSAERGQKFKQLAEYLGTDTKRAYAQFQMAQEILKGASYEDLAKVENSVVNTLEATKTGCKVGLFVAGTIATGGASTLLETGGLVIGAVDSVVEVGATACTILKGENAQITMTMKDIQDKVGTISNIVSATNLVTSLPSLATKIKVAKQCADRAAAFAKFTADAGGDAADLAMRYTSATLKGLSAAARDHVIIDGVSALLPDAYDLTVAAIEYFTEEDKVTVVTPASTENGQPTMTFTSIDLAGKSEAEASLALLAAGASIQEAQPAKTSAQIAAEMEEEFTLTEAVLDTLIEEWSRELAADVLGIPSDKIDADQMAAFHEIMQKGLLTDEAYEEFIEKGDAIPLEEIAGTWEITADAPFFYNRTAQAVFTKSGDKLMVNGIGEMTYNPDTGTARYYGAIPGEDNRANETIFVFRREAGSLFMEGIGIGYTDGERNDLWFDTDYEGRKISGSTDMPEQEALDRPEESEPTPTPKPKPDAITALSELTGYWKGGVRMNRLEGFENLPTGDPEERKKRVASWLRGKSDFELNIEENGEWSFLLQSMSIVESYSTDFTDDNTGTTPSVIRQEKDGRFTLSCMDDNKERGSVHIEMEFTAKRDGDDMLIEGVLTIHRVTADGVTLILSGDVNIEK